MLSLKKFTVVIDTHKVVDALSLDVEKGSLIIVQGHNGSGKSSLLNALAGHPFYKSTAASLTYNGISLLEKNPLERAQAGLFLITQYPPALPGVRLSTFLQESFRAFYPQHSLEEYEQRISLALSFLNLSDDFLLKPVHEHFSGGEKKRCELLQLMVLQQPVVLLDEVDSGLDKEGIKLFIQVIEWYRKTIPESIIILVTHSSTIVHQIEPTACYTMKQGSLYVTA